MMGTCLDTDDSNKNNESHLQSSFEQEQILPNKNDTKNNNTTDNKNDNENEQPLDNNKNKKSKSNKLSKQYTVLSILSDEKELEEFNFSDLTIFKDNDTEQITSDPCTMETCLKTQRLITGLKFYTMLDVENNEADQNKFDKFMRETYKEILNDYMHFTDSHNDDLERINKMLIESQVFETCDISNCRFSADHTGSAKIKDVNYKKNDFYKQTMDSLHFYVFHQYDTGLKTSKYNGNEENDANDDNITDFVDKEFEDMTNTINAKKGNQKNMTHLQRNKNKFNIQIDTKKDRTTYIDGLLVHLCSRKMVETSAVAKFAAFIHEERYDTDTLLDDVQINKDVAGNIEIEMKDNEQIIAEIRIFIRTTQTSTSSFSVGIRFYYWPFFEGRRMMPLDEQRAFNQNDHSGYRMNQLYMKKKYDTFKEEILNYEHIDWNDYEELVVLKAKNT
eukprot:254514_1